MTFAHKSENIYPFLRNIGDFVFAEPFTHAGNAPVSESFSQPSGTLRSPQEPSSALRSPQELSGALRYPQVPQPKKEAMLRAQPATPAGSTVPAQSLLFLLVQGSTLLDLLPASQPT